MLIARNIIYYFTIGFFILILTYEISMKTMNAPSPFPMKKTAFVSSALSIMALIIGLLLMLHDLPYSNYVLSISLFLLAASLIIFYTFEKELMYIAGAIFCFLPMVGLLFRQLSLPGGTLLVTAGLSLIAVFFIPWYAMKCYKA